jgi:hypothetical protein
MTWRRFDEFAKRLLWLSARHIGMVPALNARSLIHEWETPIFMVISSEALISVTA